MASLARKAAGTVAVTRIAGAGDGAGARKAAAGATTRNPKLVGGSGWRPGRPTSMNSRMKQRLGAVPSPTTPLSLYAEGERSEGLDAIMESLSRAQREWGASPTSKKIRAAEAVLSRVESLEWREAEWEGKPWATGQLYLEGYDALAGGEDAAARAHAASQKMTFGLVVKNYLQMVLRELSRRDAEAGYGSRDRPKRSVGSYDVFECESMSVPNVSAEAWCLKGAVRASTPPPSDSVCLVLGAGNQNFLSLIDVIDRVFQHDQVVLLKHHPLRPFLYAPYERILAPLVEAGLVRMVLDEGIAFAEELCSHVRVGHVHVTGSGATHDAICRTLDASGRGAGQVGVTCELGCVTPWLLCNGEWTAGEIEFQAKCLAFSKKFGGGANCLSPQALIVDDDWPQLPEFLEALKRSLRDLPTPPAYYPGAEDRLSALKGEYGPGRCEPVAGTPHPSSTSEAGSSTRPLLPVHLLDCGYFGEPDFVAAGLRKEAFCPALCLVRVRAGNDMSSFLSQATRVANDHLEGSLSCSVSCPESAKGSEDLERAIEALKYGAVGVNCSTVFGYVSSTAGGGWGAYPGLYTRENCGSGFGHIGTSRAGYAKSVVRSASVNTLADISSVPPALLSDILCSCFLSSSALQAIRRSLGVLAAAFFGLFKFSAGGPGGGYKAL